MPKAPGLEVRNLKFRVESDVPRHWHGGRRAVTLFMNNLSIFFPPGERFFIASVKAHAALVTDDKLKKDVKAFCAQEAVHSREHVRYNRMLRDQGYPVVAMEGRVERLLRWVTKVTTRRTQLAATCALEHFTALMAHILLSNPRLLDGAHPEMAALWRWHAAEENEHKAVAFDVYRAARGNYVERVGAMIGATIIFWIKVFEQQIRMMWADGCLFSISEWYSLVKYLFWEPGGMFGLFVPYLEYYRPSFHPWDHDNRALLDAFKLELVSSEVYRRAA